MFLFVVWKEKMAVTGVLEVQRVFTGCTLDSKDGNRMLGYRVGLMLVRRCLSMLALALL